MGINLNGAYAQASELRGYASELRRARSRLSDYRTALTNNWEGREAGSYIEAISSIDRRLSQAAAELDSIGDSISSTADEIWREEEAERRRQEEEAERRRQEEEAERRRQEEEAERRRQEEERQEARAAEEEALKTLTRRAEAVIAALARGGGRKK